MNGTIPRRSVARGTAALDPAAVPPTPAVLVTALRRNLGFVRSFAEDLRREREARRVHAETQAGEQRHPMPPRVLRFAELQDPQDPQREAA